MADNKNNGAIASVAGVGLALGAAALGGLIAAKKRNTHGDDAPDYLKGRGYGDLDVVGRTVTIRKPRQELYDFWRDFSNLPQFMENVEHIARKGNSKSRSTWTIKAPAGQTVDVETQVTDDVKGERIAWSSVEGSDIATEGYVEFSDAPGDRGTRVTLVIAYDPPAGTLGRTIAKIFLREPEVQARHDLKRFKMLMETGEIATSARTVEQTRAYKQENA